MLKMDLVFFKKSNGFTTITAEEVISTESIHKLKINMLYPFKNHPFTLYSGKRFDDMVQSIRENGVIFPIIVRPLDNDNYEILAGHNRFEASKAAGKDTIPAIIRENLTEDEALLIVTESNLIQRSFESMSHSERALAIANRHKAIKNKGNNTNAIAEIEKMVNINDNDSPVANKQTVIHKVGKDYSLSKDTIARYLRVNKLIGSLKKRLDCNEMGIRTAVALSYLGTDEQKLVDEVLINKNLHNLNWEDAKKLRIVSENEKLDTATIERILTETNNQKTQGAITIKVKAKTLINRFVDMNQDEIEDMITKALEYYEKYVMDKSNIQDDIKN